MGAQPVAEGEVPLEFFRAGRKRVEMVGHKLRFVIVFKDLAPIDAEIADMGITIGFQCVFNCLKALSNFKDDVNVNDRFRRQPGHRSAANVFNTHILP